VRQLILLLGYSLLSLHLNWLCKPKQDNTIVISIVSYAIISIVDCKSHDQHVTNQVTGNRLNTITLVFTAEFKLAL